MVGGSAPSRVILAFGSGFVALRLAVSLPLSLRSADNVYLTPAHIGGGLSGPIG